MHVSVRIINQHPRGQGDSRDKRNRDKSGRVSSSRPGISIRTPHQKWCTMRGYEKKYNYFIRYVMYFVLELLLLIELFT